MYRIDFDLWWLRLARALPARLRYWAVIVAAAEATTGKYGATEVPALTIADLLQRIEK
jgi:hypothetical protein